MDIKIVGITFHLEIPDVDVIKASLQRIEAKENQILANQEEVLDILGSQPQITFNIGPVSEQES